MTANKDDLKKRLGLLRDSDNSDDIEVRIVEAMKKAQQRAKRFNASCRVSRGALHGEVAL